MTIEKQFTYFTVQQTETCLGLRNENDLREFQANDWHQVIKNKQLINVS